MIGKPSGHVTIHGHGETIAKALVLQGNPRRSDVRLLPDEADSQLGARLGLPSGLCPGRDLCGQQDVGVVGDLEDLHDNVDEEALSQSRQLLRCKR